MTIQVNSIIWDLPDGEVETLPTKVDMEIRDFCGPVVEADYKGRLEYSDGFSAFVAERLSEKYEYCTMDFTIDILEWR